MKKRIISHALSAITVISAVSLPASNAFNGNWGNISESKIEEQFGHLEKLDSKEYECINQAGAENLYLLENNDSIMYTYEVAKQDDYLYIGIGKDTDVEKLKEELLAFDENFKYALHTGLTYMNYLKVERGEISIETVKKVREYIGNKAIDFQYHNNVYHYRAVRYDYITSYYRYQYKIEKDFTDEKIGETPYELLMEYAENHSYEVEFRTYTIADGTDHRGITLDMTLKYYVIPKKELAGEEVTLMEYLELAKDIYEETGLKPFGQIYESAVTPIDVTIDLTNYLNGDANNDQITSIADAAAIMQAIGNPDKYSLSDMGEFNADYDNNGLTVDDAVEIQKRLAGIAE